MAKRKPSKADRPMDPYSQLALCIVMDILGAATYLLPVVGELGDIIYAPIQMVVAWSIFGGEKWGLTWTVIAGAEELLPLTDVIPSMTIGWSIKYLGPMFEGKGRARGA